MLSTIFNSLTNLSPIKNEEQVVQVQAPFPVVPVAEVPASMVSPVQERISIVPTRTSIIPMRTSVLPNRESVNPGRMSVVPTTQEEQDMETIKACVGRISTQTRCEDPKVTDSISAATVREELRKKINPLGRNNQRGFSSSVPIDQPQVNQAMDYELNKHDSLYNLAKIQKMTASELDAVIRCNLKGQALEKYVRTISYLPDFLTQHRSFNFEKLFENQEGLILILNEKKDLSMNVNFDAQNIVIRYMKEIRVAGPELRVPCRVMVTISPGQFHFLFDTITAVIQSRTAFFSHDTLMFITTDLSRILKAQRCYAHISISFGDIFTYEIMSNVDPMTQAKVIDFKYCFAGQNAGRINV